MNKHIPTIKILKLIMKIPKIIYNFLNSTTISKIKILKETIILIKHKLTMIFCTFSPKFHKILNKK